MTVRHGEVGPQLASVNRHGMRSALHFNWLLPWNGNNSLCKLAFTCYLVFFWPKWHPIWKLVYLKKKKEKGWINFKSANRNSKSNRTSKSICKPKQYWRFNACPASTELHNKGWGSLAGMSLMWARNVISPLLGQIGKWSIHLGEITLLLSQLESSFCWCVHSRVA